MAFAQRKAGGVLNPVNGVDAELLALKAMDFDTALVAGLICSKRCYLSSLPMCTSSLLLVTSWWGSLGAKFPTKWSLPA